MLLAAHQRSWIRCLTGASLLCALAALSGCCSAFSAGCSNSSADSAAAAAYSLSATISGLNSSGLVLTVDDIPIGVTNGTSTQLLSASLASGTQYSVTVAAQPTGQTCSVAHGSGTIQGANVANILVACSDQAYSLGGSISGLTSAGLVLANDSDTLTVSSGAGSFMMPALVTYGSPYALTVQTQPLGLTCTAGNNAGTMPAGSINTVVITCVSNVYTVGGSISGLTGSGLILLDNGGDATSIDANATQFKMNTAIAYGGAYAITVQTVPAGLVCRVSNGSGTMGAGNVTGVSIGCVPNFTLLYSFAGGSSDGANPYHSLIQASDGNFYGTTLKGGSSSDGTIVEITPSGAESVLYSFTKSGPYAGLTQASDHNFYGTTQDEGTGSSGTIFELTPSGSESVLYSFPAGNSEPYCGVIQGSDGDFYGTTSYNGTSDHGTVFKIAPGGTETVLHVFPKVSSGDGAYPYAGVIQASDGNFYGTTYNGGANSDGTVFKVTPGGTETVVYSFAGGTDGANPYAGVIQGSDGNFYGTTYNGGAHGLGTVYKLTPGGIETVLYSFAGGSDGANPEAGLTQGSDGNLYGATYLGGAGSLGTVFRLTPGGTETVLHSFAGGSSDGANDWANLVQGSDGNLYGTTYAGGAGGLGTFFKITLQ